MPRTRRARAFLAALAALDVTTGGWLVHTESNRRDARAVYTAVTLPQAQRLMSSIHCFQSGQVRIFQYTDDQPWAYAKCPGLGEAGLLKVFTTSQDKLTEQASGGDLCALGAGDAYRGYSSVYVVAGDNWYFQTFYENEARSAMFQATEQLCGAPL